MVRKQGIGWLGITRTMSHIDKSTYIVVAGELPW